MAGQLLNAVAVAALVAYAAAMTVHCARRARRRIRYHLAELGAEEGARRDSD